MAPLAAVHAHLCGLHFVSGRMDRQVTTHHFCAPVNEDLMQCILYDGPGKGARLIGVEYVLSARGFKALPSEEKKLWHSHAFEVKGGLLVAPGRSASAEKALLRNLATTYGKTWHTWQVDRGDPLPLGIPQLMMGFTGEGQVTPANLASYDQQLGSTQQDRKRQRADLPDPLVDPEADAWQKAPPVQLELKPQGPPPVQRIPMH